MPQLKRKLTMTAVGVAVALGAGDTADATGPKNGERAAKPCGAGLLHVIVRRRHICRPAPDLRVAVSDSPTANRVGGTFTYGVSVANRGRRAATSVALTLRAGAAVESASTTTGSCSSSATAGVRCELGSLVPRAEVSITVVIRATAIVQVDVRAQATSRTRDARPRDNTATATSRVTEPDAVRGRGTRPTAGPGVRPPVEVEVDAVSGPAGNDPTGTFWTRYPTGTPEFRGRVVCLTVSGTRASVGGVIEQSNDPNNPPGTGILFAFIDKAIPAPGMTRPLCTSAATLMRCSARSRSFVRGRNHAHRRQLHGQRRAALGVAAAVSETRVSAAGSGLVRASRSRCNT